MNFDVKVSPEEFESVAAGRQTALVRLNDNYAIGDMLTIREFDVRHAKYTDRVAVRRVTHLMSGDNFMGGAVLSPRYVIMSLAQVEHPNGDVVAGTQQSAR